MEWHIEKPRLFLAKETWQPDCVKAWLPIATKPNRVMLSAQLVSVKLRADFTLSDSFVKELTDLVKNALVAGLKLTSGWMDTERFEDYSTVRNDFLTVATDFESENGRIGEYRIGDPSAMDIKLLSSYTDETLDQLQAQIANGHQAQVFWDRGSVAPLQASKAVQLWD